MGLLQAAAADDHEETRKGCRVGEDVDAAYCQDGDGECQVLRRSRMA